MMYRDARGWVRSVPVDWTSLAAPDPYVALSTGRSLFRPEDLLALAARVRSLLVSRPSCGQARGPEGVT